MRFVFIGLNDEIQILKQKSKFWRLFFVWICVTWICSFSFSITGDWITSGVFKRILICNCWLYFLWFRMISLSSSRLSIFVRSSLNTFESFKPIITESSALRRRCRVFDSIKPKNDSNQSNLNPKNIYRHHLIISDI